MFLALKLYKKTNLLITIESYYLNFIKFNIFLVQTLAENQQHCLANKIEKDYQLKLVEKSIKKIDRPPLPPAYNLAQLSTRKHQVNNNNNVFSKLESIKTSLPISDTTQDTFTTIESKDKDIALILNSNEFNKNLPKCNCSSATDLLTLDDLNLTTKILTNNFDKDEINFLTDSKPLIFFQSSMSKPVTTTTKKIQIISATKSEEKQCLNFSENLSNDANQSNKELYVLYQNNKNIPIVENNCIQNNDEVECDIDNNIANDDEPIWKLAPHGVLRQCSEGAVTTTSIAQAQKSMPYLLRVHSYDENANINVTTAQLLNLLSDNNDKNNEEDVSSLHLTDAFAQSIKIIERALV